MFKVALVLLLNSISFAKTPAPFSFHLFGEPYSLDPVIVGTSTGGYLFSNIFRGLYRYHPEKGLIPEEAESCQFNKQTLKCILKKDLKYSNGQSVVAKDYLRSFRRLMDPDSNSIQKDLLLSLKNAKAILAKEKSVDQLGVTAPDDRTLIFEFENEDPDFLYRLTSNSLVPFPENLIPDRDHVKRAAYNGPYQITEWVKGQRIKLEPNPYFPGAKDRIPVEIFIIDEDSTALRLYESGKMQMIRRVPTTDAPALDKRADFRYVPVARFDYIGFGPDLKNQEDLRKAFAYSLNYAELQGLLKALGRPGCPALPKRLLKTVPCIDFDLAKAKKYWDKVPKKIRERKFILGFSKMGGDGVQQQMEWMQHQWKKNLGANIELLSMENSSYTNLLKTRPPDIFRKGIGLDRPTCLAGLEVFSPHDRENYIRLDDPEYNSQLKKLKMAKTEEQKKQICTAASKRLISSPFLIPLGEMYFGIMARPQYKGWWLNEINQLDLTDLIYSP